MADPRCETGAEGGGGRLPAGEMPERTTEEVSINYEREAPRGTPGRRIHERMPVPRVPEGDDVPDRRPSPPLDI